MLQRTAVAVSIHCRCTPGTSGAVGGGSRIRAHFSLGAPLGHRCLLILHTGIHPERSAQQSAHTDTKWWSWDSSQDSNPAACTNPSGPGWVLLPGAMKGKAHTHCPRLRMRTTWGACWQAPPLCRTGAAQQSESLHPNNRKAAGRAVEGAKEPGHSTFPAICPELPVAKSRGGLQRGTRWWVSMVIWGTPVTPRHSLTEPLFLSLPNGSSPWAEPKQDLLGTSAPSRQILQHPGASWNLHLCSSLLLSLHSPVTLSTSH